MPPQDPNDPDTTDEDRTDVWEETGSRAPLRPLTPDEQRALGAQGLGGKRIVAREASRQDDIRRGIGTNEPPLIQSEREKAVLTSLQVQQARLTQLRLMAEALPESSERSHELAVLRSEQEKLDKKREALS